MGALGDLHQVAALAPARAALYRFVAAPLLASPPRETLAALARPHLAEGLGALFGDRVATLFAELLYTPPSPEEVRHDHDDLLVVPLGRYLAPYEAVYVDERLVGDRKVRGLLMGPSTLDVQACYRAAGAYLESQCRELPDHVGVELSFMAFLCTREREAWEREGAHAARAWLARERDFVDRHLERWVPELCRRMAERAATAFYRGLALLIVEFLASEAGALRAMATGLGGPR